MKRMRPPRSCSPSAALGMRRSRRGSRRSGNTVTTVRALGSTLPEAAAAAVLPARLASRQWWNSRSARPAAAIVPRPEAAPTRPAPSPSWRQSRHDRPMINSSSRPTIAAAVIEIGNAAALRPALETSRCKAHPTAPPNLIPGAGNPASRTDRASAPSARTTGSNAPLSQIDLSGRFSSRRNDQPSSTVGIKNAPRPKLCRKRSATTAPFGPRKLCGAASTAVFNDGSRGS